MNVTKSKQRKQKTKPKGALESLGREVGHTADQAWNLAKKALSMLNVEYKEVSVGYTGSSNTIDYNGTLLLATSNVSQGNTDSTRNGDSIKLQRLRGLWAFFRSGADAIVRVIVTVEGSPGINANSNVCEAAGSSNAPLSMPSWDYRHNFRVVYDKCITLTTQEPEKVLDMDLKFDHDVQYIAGGTNVAQGQVTVWFFSDLVTSNLPFVRATAQLSWLDN